MQTLARYVTLFAAVLASGCMAALGNMVAAQRPTYDAVESRLPPPSSTAAQVVVYYPAGAAASVITGPEAVSFSIDVKSFLLTAKHFMIIDVPPGQHLFGPPTHGARKRL